VVLVVLEGMVSAGSTLRAAGREQLAFEILPEESLRSAVDVMVRLVEAAGAVVIFIGALIAVAGFVRALPRRNPNVFVPVRLTLGRFLALGLEFQLASDILRTAIAPSFDQIGKLAAIAAIRTALNFFLAREVAEEQRILDQGREDATRLDKDVQRG
jgi:uncharacterized membrane protein